MNKPELIAAVAEKAGLTKKDAEKAVNAAFEAITAELIKGEKVSLAGFGIFETKTREARTGETTQIAAATVPAFKASKTLKGAVNK